MHCFKILTVRRFLRKGLACVAAPVDDGPQEDLVTFLMVRFLFL